MADLKLLGTAEGIYFGTFNDLAFNENKDLSEISNASYVRQKVTKAFLTTLGASEIFPGYGSGLQNIVNNTLNTEGADELIKNAVLYTLSYIEEQETSDSASEHIQSLDDLVIDHSEGTLSVLITMTLTLRNGEKLFITLGQ